MFDVITIGTATRDVFLTSPLFKIVRDPKHLRKMGFPTGEAQCFALGGKIEVEDPVMTVGGGAANAAVTFARQRFATASIFKVGWSDEHGKAVLWDLKKEGIKFFPAFDKKAMTAYSVILLSPGGERTILNYRGASEDLTERDVRWAKLKDTSSAYIAPGRIAFPLMMKMVKRLKMNGAMIAIDLSKYYLGLGLKKLKPLLNNIDVIHVNREEGSYLTGVPYENVRGIFRRFDKLAKGLAVMTDGPRGVVVSDGKTLYRAGVYREKKLVDRTGAGDAFTSGFVAALLRARPRDGRWERPAVESAIRLGSANATAVVEEIGAQAGILSRRQFEGEGRWRRLAVQVSRL